MTKSKWPTALEVWAGVMVSHTFYSLYPQLRVHSLSVSVTDIGLCSKGLEDHVRIETASTLDLQHR